MCSRVLHLETIVIDTVPWRLVRESIAVVDPGLVADGDGADYVELAAVDASFYRIERNAAVIAGLPVDVRQVIRKRAAELHQLEGAAARAGPGGIIDKDES